jgi:hypothetical protein
MHGWADRPGAPRPHYGCSGARFQGRAGKGAPSAIPIIATSTQTPKIITFKCYYYNYFIVITIHLDEFRQLNFTR